MSEKNRDDKNRWRNVTIAFRMSPEENDELNNRVKLSGFRTKQDWEVWMRKVDEIGRMIGGYSEWVNSRERQK